MSLGATTAAVVSTWLARKGLDWTWTQISTLISPKDFKQLLDLAWANDPTLREACDPPPTFDHARLNAKRSRQLLNFALNQDERGLGEFLIEEQLIDLPWTNCSNPKPIVEIGKCAARVTIETTIKAITAKESLFREFQVYASQQNATNVAEILVALSQLQHTSSELAASLSRVDEFAGDQQSKMVAGADKLLLVNDCSSHQVLDTAIRRNVLLEQTLVKLLDEKGQAIWQGIQDELRQWNYKAAHAYGSELEQWLARDGQSASTAIRGRAHLLLAHMALADDSGRPLAGNALLRANDFYQKASESYGENPAPCDEARLARFRAKRFAISGKHDLALSELENWGDANAFLLRLTILLDADRTHEAAALANDREFEAEWVEEAITAFSRVGDCENTLRAFSWASQLGDQDTVDRCRLVCAYSHLATTRATPSDPLLPSCLNLTEHQTGAIREAIAVLAPVTSRISAQANANSGIEAEVAAVGYACLRVLGAHEQATVLIRSLKHWNPIHEAYVRAALRGDAECDPSLAQRLRKDYPDDFSLRLLAVDIDFDCGVSRSKVVNELRRLKRLATNDHRRGKLARFAFQIATASIATSAEEDVLSDICSLTSDTAGCYQAVR